MLPVGILHTGSSTAASSGCKGHEPLHPTYLAAICSPISQIDFRTLICPTSRKLSACSQRCHKHWCCQPPAVSGLAAGANGIGIFGSTWGKVPEERDINFYNG